jgi:hypothetical protein
MELRALQINDVDAGSIDWELPKKLADELAAAPPEAQKAIEQFLKRELTEHLLILMTAVISSNPGAARQIVMQSRSATARMLAMANGQG